MIRNVQVEMSWLTLVRLVVITASLVTERRFVAPTGRLSFSMRLLDCFGDIPILGKMFFLYGVLDSLDTQDLIFWTKNSGIKYILHTFATTFARSEFFCALELWEAKCLQNHFPAKLQALSCASFTSAVCVFEQRSFENIWNKLFSPCHYMPIFFKRIM